MVFYVDDMEIYVSVKDVSVVENCVNKDLVSIVFWWNENGLISNYKKCEVMLIGFKYVVKNI